MECDEGSDALRYRMLSTLSTYNLALGKDCVTSCSAQGYGALSLRLWYRGICLTARSRALLLHEGVENLCCGPLRTFDNNRDREEGWR